MKRKWFSKLALKIYASSDAWVDFYFIVHQRCSKAMISHDAALYYYGLNDKEPAMPTMTIYSGYNASRLKNQIL